MTPIEEIKVRARLLLNAIDRADPAALARARRMATLRRWPMPDAWTLALCLNIVSAEAGFRQWEHARCVLAGEARPGDDMGTLWYDDACAAFVNHWFAGYEEARAALQSDPRYCLFPYGRQFVVGDAPFIDAIGLAAGASILAAIDRDVVAAYGRPAWRELVLMRLQHGRSVTVT